MSRTRLFRPRGPAGQSPGTVAYRGPERKAAVGIRLIDYGPGHLEERPVDPGEELPPWERPGVTWLDVDGVHDTALLERLGERYGIHPLALEDIASTDQRPKAEDLGAWAFVVVKMLRFDAASGRVDSEQVSLLWRGGLVISFQERPGDVFDPVRRRIREGRGRIRTMGADYLAYALLDAVVDHVFVVLEGVGTQIEALEEASLGQETDGMLPRLHSIRREVVLLRRAVWPLREVVGSLLREGGHVGAKVQPFMRDVHDHVTTAIETLDSYREILGGLADLTLNNLSHRMNEVMRVLTVIATIFIPLTFVAGIYGMNFESMPELGWRYGYPALIVVMGIAAIVMALAFRRRGWL